MKALAAFDAAYLHKEPVDMRRSIDGLSALVRHGMGRPMTGRHLFVFIGRRRDRVKLLYFDRTGYALWYKRLEKARFHWPADGGDVVELSPEILSFLLDGVDVFVRPHVTLDPPQK